MILALLLGLPHRSLPLSPSMCQPVGLIGCNLQLFSGPSTTNTTNTRQPKRDSRSHEQAAISFAWFRSTVLWVMGPSRFRCATKLLVACCCRGLEAVLVWVRCWRGREEGGVQRSWYQPTCLPQCLQPQPNYKPKPSNASQRVRCTNNYKLQPQ
jgi:hypothetical protein